MKYALQHFCGRGITVKLMRSKRTLNTGALLLYNSCNKYCGPTTYLHARVLGVRENEPPPLLQIVA